MAQSGNPLAQPDLDTLLATLARHGASGAEFSPDGQLTKVAFWAPGMTDLLGELGKKSDETERKPNAVETAADRLLNRGKARANGSH